MHQPFFACQTCQQQWAPEFMDLVNSGYWPASTSSSTLYSLNLFSSVRELKVIAPALSRQAFAKLLEHRTKCGGQVSVHHIIELFNICRHLQSNNSYNASFSQDRCAGTRCSAASWSFPIALLRKISCPAVHLSPAPLAPQTCWQSLWMATGSYTGFSEAEGDIFSFQYRLICIF